MVPGSDRPAKRPRILNHLQSTPPQPLSTLSPKALKLLDAAQRIVLRDGFAQLSFANVAEEAHLYQSAVRYYFSSKAGLVQALVDASTHDLSAEVYAAVRDEDPLSERLATVIHASRTVPGSEAYRSWWELLPHVLRDEELRADVAALYETYRAHSEAVFDDRQDPAYRELARTYACLMLAVVEGIALQYSLDPEAVDVERTFRLWSKIVSRSVEEIVAEEAGAATD